ncbi:SDR family oxidoreductase, partial [Chloroflexota bacterium]
ELEAHLEKKKGETCIGRIGSVEDIATIALFLASDETSFITGQVISSDGGRLVG